LLTHRDIGESLKKKDKRKGSRNQNDHTNNIMIAPCLIFK